VAAPTVKAAAPARSYASNPQCGRPLHRRWFTPWADDTLGSSGYWVQTTCRHPAATHGTCCEHTQQTGSPRLHVAHRRECCDILLGERAPPHRATTAAAITTVATITPTTASAVTTPIRISSISSIAITTATAPAVTTPARFEPLRFEPLRGPRQPCGDKRDSPPRRV
jgi:hypothetical protein